VVSVQPGASFGLGDLGSPAALVALGELVFITVWTARGLPGGMVLGIVLGGIACVLLGLNEFAGVIGLPPSMAPTVLALDFPGLLLRPEAITAIVILVLLHAFDSVETLLAIAVNARIVEGYRVPRAAQAMATEAVGTAAAGLLGTSTITSTIESNAGVMAGGRTGLTAVVGGLWFLPALFLFPAVVTISGGAAAGNLYAVQAGVSVGTIALQPALGPVLIVIGAIMARGAQEVPWLDLTEAVPAFMTIAGMTLTFSIAEGLALGFASYAVIKLLSGKGRQVTPLVWGLAVLAIGRYVLHALY
jgi:adenine/guanine/hypoxanthine permease